ncbi:MULTISPECIES: hypothetical protein [Paracoccus]|uniref:hypothetical protein n=1 Tax=Paracoccus TaxID=265 RepID=UPI001111BAB0|nr:MULTISPECIES: hypothetical protein [Paracoccus]TNB89650.1 hypothetical protein FHD68_17140 [Paracoccus marcusii]
MTCLFPNRPATVRATIMAAVLPAAALAASAQATPAAPATTAEADAAAEVRGAELAQGVERITEPYLVSLHCLARMSEAFGFERDAAADAAGSACEAKAGARLVEIAGERASRALSEIEAAPHTLDAAIEANGYAPADNDFARISASAAYRAGAREIDAAFEGARRAGAARRNEVLEAERQRLDAAMDALDPARHELADLPECAAFDAGQPWLRPLLSHCRDLRQRFAARHTHLRCERLFEIAPAELRYGAFDVGGGETVNATALLCDYGFEAEARTRGGIFSASRTELSLQLGPLEAPLTLTGTLHGPDAAGLWQLRDLSLIPGRLARDLDPDAPETLHQCLANPARCQE